MQPYTFPLIISGIILGLNIPVPAKENSVSKINTLTPETIPVACGALDKENCGTVLPEINIRLEPRGSKLLPYVTEGSVGSLINLCQGTVNIAIVQEDALVAALQIPDCGSAIQMLGTPLYPSFGFLISLSEARLNNFSEITKAAKRGQVIKIATGGPRSGGDLTFRNILESTPKNRPFISLLPYEGVTALEKLQNKEIDSYFLMDCLSSPRVKALREAKVAATGKSLFKISGVTLESSFFARLKQLGLYGLAPLERHWLSSTKTIANPVVIAIRENFLRDHPDIVRDLELSVRDALPSLALDAGAPATWKAEFFQQK